MNEVRLSDVQRANLTMLMAIKNSVNQDAVWAGCKFGLRAEEVKFFSAVSLERILALVANVGEESLFRPREDLCALLQRPLPLCGPITAARPAVVAAGSQEGTTSGRK